MSKGDLEMLIFSGFLVISLVSLIVIMLIVRDIVRMRREKEEND